MNHVWRPVIDLELPGADGWQRIITFVEGPVHEVGRSGHRDVDCRWIVPQWVRSKGIPCAIVPEEPRIWEIPKDPDGLVSLDVITRILMFGPVGLPFIFIRIVALSYKHNWKSNDECNNDNRRQASK